MKNNTKSGFIAKAGLIAALYATITIIVAPISSGQIQVRVSEALTVLPYFEPAAIVGLFIGCIVANAFVGNGPWDIVLGSILTLVAAILTWLIGKFFKSKKSKSVYYYIGPILALLPPVIINAFGVAFILKIVLELPYWISVIYVGAGQFIAVYLLGYPLLMMLFKSGFFTPLTDSQKD